MNPNYNFSFYEGNDAFESALLRSILVFNNVGKQRSENDMMLRALFALIVNADNKATKGGILDTLKKRFSLIWSEKLFDQHLSILKEMKLADTNDQGYIVALEQRKDGRDFFRGINEKTNTFLEGLLARLREVYRAEIPDEKKIKVIIKKSISVYLRQSSFEFFNVKMKASTEETVEAISFIKQEVKPDILAEALIRVIADTLMNSTDYEKEFLEQWARAYIAMQVIGLDPSLTNFKDSKLRNKSFVLDTDVVLHIITKYAKYSEVYHQMFKKLRNIGCKFYLPFDVFTEVEKNCNAARTKYLIYGASLKTMTDDYLEHTIGNVLVEDYAKMLRIHPEMDDYRFEDYLSNIYDRNDPSLLKQNIIDVIGKDNYENRLPEYTYQEALDALKLEILERTENTPKGYERPKEINENLSETDAILYYTICKMNEENDDDSFFARKVYLLTRSKRTSASAKQVGMYQRNIICHPEALLSILMENGGLNTGEVKLVNLFDNPFLIYTAHQIWEHVDPLLKAGAKFKYAELNKLRLDVHTHIDRILTSRTPDERYEEARYLEENGYLFAQQIRESKDAEEAAKANAAKAYADAEIYKKQAEESELKSNEKDKIINKLLGKLHYQNRITKGLKRKKRK